MYPQITGQLRVQLWHPAIDPERRLGKMSQLVFGSQNDQAIPARTAQEVRADLLIAAPDEEALLASHSQNDPDRTICGQLVKRRRVEIASNHRSIAYGVDAKDSGAMPGGAQNGARA
jgi:hypothetical protein